jgi:hypothetical protein
MTKELSRFVSVYQRIKIERLSESDIEAQLIRPLLVEFAGWRTDDVKVKRDPDIYCE